MTALVACLGLLPAALSTGIGSDTQKPFAIVIVRRPGVEIVHRLLVNPVIYKTIAREGDVLQCELNKAVRDAFRGGQMNPRRWRCAGTDQAASGRSTEGNMT